MDFGLDDSIAIMVEYYINDNDIGETTISAVDIKKISADIANSDEVQQVICSKIEEAINEYRKGEK